MPEIPPSALEQLFRVLRRVHGEAPPDSLINAATRVAHDYPDLTPEFATFLEGTLGRSYNSDLHALQEFTLTPGFRGIARPSSRALEVEAVPTFERRRQAPSDPEAERALRVERELLVEPDYVSRLYPLLTERYTSFREVSPPNEHTAANFSRWARNRTDLSQRERESVAQLDETLERVFPSPEQPPLQPPSLAPRNESLPTYAADSEAAEQAAARAIPSPTNDESFIDNLRRELMSTGELNADEADVIARRTAASRAIPAPTAPENPTAIDRTNPALQEIARGANLPVDEFIRMYPGAARSAMSMPTPSPTLMEDIREFERLSGGLNPNYNAHTFDAWRRDRNLFAINRRRLDIETRSQRDWPDNYSPMSQEERDAARSQFSSMAHTLGTTNLRSATSEEIVNATQVEWNRIKDALPEEARIRAENHRDFISKKVTEINDFFKSRKFDPKKLGVVLVSALLAEGVLTEEDAKAAGVTAESIQDAHTSFKKQADPPKELMFSADAYPKALRPIVEDIATNTHENDPKDRRDFDRLFREFPQSAKFQALPREDKDFIVDTLSKRIADRRRADQGAYYEDAAQTEQLVKDEAKVAYRLPQLRAQGAKESELQPWQRGVLEAARGTLLTIEPSLAARLDKSPEDMKQGLLTALYHGSDTFQAMLPEHDPHDLKAYFRALGVEDIPAGEDWTNTAARVAGLSLPVIAGYGAYNLATGAKSIPALRALAPTSLAEATTLAQAGRSIATHALRGESVGYAFNKIYAPEEPDAAKNALKWWGGFDVGTQVALAALPQTARAAMAVLGKTAAREMKPETLKLPGAVSRRLEEVTPSGVPMFEATEVFEKGLEKLAGEKFPKSGPQVARPLETLSEAERLIHFQNRPVHVSRNMLEEGLNPATGKPIPNPPKGSIGFIREARDVQQTTMRASLAKDVYDLEHDIRVTDRDLDQSVVVERLKEARLKLGAFDAAIAAEQGIPPVVAKAAGALSKASDIEAHAARISELSQQFESGVRDARYELINTMDNEEVTRMLGVDKATAQAALEDFYAGKGGATINWNRIAQEKNARELRAADEAEANIMRGLPPEGIVVEDVPRVTREEVTASQPEPPHSDLAEMFPNTLKAPIEFTGFHGTRTSGKHATSFGGLHIGTEEAAVQRLINTPSEMIGGKPGAEKLQKVSIQARNPIGTPEVPIDENDLYLRINTEEGRKSLEGHDVVFYQNMVENEGSVSALILDNNAIRSISEHKSLPNVMRETAATPSAKSGLPLDLTELKRRVEPFGMTAFPYGTPMGTKVFVRYKGKWGGSGASPVPSESRVGPFMFDDLEHAYSVISGLDARTLEGMHDAELRRSLIDFFADYKAPSALFKPASKMTAESFKVR